MSEIRLDTGGATARSCWRNAEARKRAARAKYRLRHCEHAHCVDIAYFGQKDGRASGKASEVTYERASMSIVLRAQTKASSNLIFQLYHESSVDIWKCAFELKQLRVRPAASVIRPLAQLCEVAPICQTARKCVELGSFDFIPCAMRLFAILLRVQSQPA